MGLLSFHRRLGKRINSSPNSGQQVARRGFGRMHFEQLEQRSMLTILSMTVDGVQSDNSIQEPAGKDLFVPIVATDDGGDAISYSVTSSNPAVTVTPVPGSTYLTLNVNGTDSSGNAYSGVLTFKLFDSLTPNTVSTIESQVNSGDWNNTTFARILNDISTLVIAEGNYTSTGDTPAGTGQQFDDEFNSQLTFDSQGMLAWANAGPDTNDLQYFVSGVDEPGTTTPLTQSDLASTRFLDYRYTIFGQLVDGLSTFNTIMNSTLTTNNATGEDSLPSPLINVTSASIVTNTQDTVLDVSAPTSAAGQTATLSITATEANGAVAENAFTVNVVADTIIDPPFLGTIPELVTTNENTPVAITLPATNPDGATIQYQIVDPGTGGPPPNVTVGPIDPTTGDVTLTPDAGFTGTISLLAQVEGTNSDNTNPDTQPFTLTVNAPPVPNAPTDLTATAPATNEVSLLWTAPSSTVTGYDVYRGTSSGGESSTPLNSTPLSATAASYEDLTATAGTTYFYTVQALDGSSGSAMSNEATATTPTTGPTVSAPPTNLTASVASASEIDLSWTDATDTVTGYNVFRGTSIGGESTTPLNSTPLSSTATSYQDTTVASGTTYFYEVQAVDGTASSPSSNEATATTSGSTPTATGAPTLQTPNVVSTSEIDLAWTAGTGTVTGYNVLRGTTAGGESTTPLNSTPLSSTTTTYQDTTVAAGTTYFYVVQAVNGATSSPNSNEQTATAASTTGPAAPSLTLDSTSETGLLTNDNYTSQATPMVDATADPGDTVAFSVNGQTFTETANSSGLAQATLPAGTLAVGANSVTSTAGNSSGSSTTSSALTVTYAPSDLQVYTVPGAIGASETLTVTWTARHAGYNDEIGVYQVSDTTGTVDSIAPGGSGYAQAAIGGTTDGGKFAQVVFPSGDTGGETMNLTVTGGELLAFYMIQNNTSANFLAKNPTDAGNRNSSSSQPTAFFTTTAANPDSAQHVQVVADPTTGTAQYAWEDEDFIAGSDKDYNDVVMTVALSTGETADPGTLIVPGTGGGNISLSATLASGTHNSTAPGDVGVYFVDNPTGSIGSLTPSSSGYLAAALASGNSQVLIASGTAAGAAAQSITVPAGKYIAFYSISSGTTANFLSTNPTNGTTTSGLPNAFLSFPSANPSQINHFSFTSPEGITTNPNQTQLHVMNEVMGSSVNFDDLDLDLSFAAGS